MVHTSCSSRDPTKTIVREVVVPVKSRQQNYLVRLTSRIRESDKPKVRSYFTPKQRLFTAFAKHTFQFRHFCLLVGPSIALVHANKLKPLFWSQLNSPRPATVAMSFTYRMLRGRTLSRGRFLPVVAHCARCSPETVIAHKCH